MGDTVVGYAVEDAVDGDALGLTVGCCVGVADGAGVTVGTVNASVTY